MNKNRQRRLDKKRQEHAAKMAPLFSNGPREIKFSVAHKLKARIAPIPNKEVIYVDSTIFDEAKTLVMEFGLSSKVEIRIKGES